MALSTSNRRRLITNSTTTNNNNNNNTNNSFSLNKQSRTEHINRSNLKSANTSNTENAVTSLALNKEKRHIGVKQENGYLNGTAATTVKTKRPINQVNDTLPMKKSKLLKTNHLQNRSNNSSSVNNSPSNSQMNNSLKQNRSNGKIYVKNFDEKSKINGKKFLNKPQKCQDALLMSKKHQTGIFGLDENESETFSMYDFSSKDEYKLGEEFYEQRLNKLNEQLIELTNLKNNSAPDSTTSISVYYDQVNKLERESKETLEITKIVYEKQKNEIEQQYLNEYNKTVQDYHDKRREIKENLKNEQEEMRKQIDIDRNCLDINADITDAKPVPTRNLRRRQNANATLNMTANYDLDTDVDASILIQNSVMGANLINVHGSSSVSMVNSGLSVVNSSTSMILGQYSGSSLNHPNSLSSLYSAIANSSALANSMINQGVNDRKRKLNPPSAITLALNEEEMNEELKFLLKNLNNHTLLINQSKNASSLALSSSSTSVSSSVTSPKLKQNVNDII
jgi:hypothetical protein